MIYTIVYSINHSLSLTLSTLPARPNAASARAPRAAHPNRPPPHCCRNKSFTRALRPFPKRSCPRSPFSRSSVLSRPPPPGPARPGSAIKLPIAAFASIPESMDKTWRKLFIRTLRKYARCGVSLATAIWSVRSGMAPNLKCATFPILMRRGSSFCSSAMRVWYKNIARKGM